LLIRKTKRWISAATILSMVIGVGAPFQKAQAAADQSSVIDILQIPDLHGMIINDEKRPIGAVIGANIDYLRGQNPSGTLVLGGGDNYAGKRSPELSRFTLGASVMRVFNAYGMEASTVGNHEFDWGLETSYKDVPAEFPLLAANIYDRATGNRVFDSYKIFTKNGAKIAIIGAVTQDTSDAIPGTVDAYELKDIAEEVNKAAIEARKDGAEIIVANIHEEHGDDPKSGPIYDVVKQLKGVDAVLGAHAHRDLIDDIVDAEGKSIPLIIGRDRAQNMVHMAINVTRHGDNSLSINSFNREAITLNSTNTVYPYGWMADNPVKSERVQAIIDQDLADVEATKSAMEQLNSDMSSVSALVRNLPAAGANGTKITWTSEKPEVVSSSGQVRRPAEDAKLTLTALVSKGFAKISSEPFEVTVKKADAKVGKWRIGEFHAHTFQSNDAQVSLQSVLDAAFNKYGMDYLALANHLRPSGRDDEGHNVPEGRDIPFLQGAMEYEVPKTNLFQNEGKYAGKTVFSGFEWDAPGHDHVAVGILTDEPNSEKSLKTAYQFEYMFSPRTPVDIFKPEDVAAWEKEGIKRQPTSTHADTMAAMKWLNEKYPLTSYLLITHPNRGRGKSKIADLRDINNAAPTINFGFEGILGNQMEPDRGGYDTKYNPNDPNDDGYKYRSHGGADYMLSQVGGAWDALLGEGRKYWTFANSDYHFKTIGTNSSGYQPGEYSKNYTWTNGNEIQDIIDGMRSGKSFSVTGDLINALDFNLAGDGEKKEMGETLIAKEGDSLKLTIRFKSPKTNNYESIKNGKLNNTTPPVDHVDLIAGDVTGYAQPGTDAYNKDTNDSTKVIATFTDKDWTVDQDGYNVITYDLKSSTKNQYFRLRGTNLGMNVPGKTENGNPVVNKKIETADAEARFDEINDQNYSDLWFYSNPIFLESSAYSDDQAVIDALASLSLGDLSAVTGNLTLPVKGGHDVAITWTSSVPSLMTDTGKLVKQPDQSTDLELTATATRGAATKTKAFKVTIKGTGSGSTPTYPPVDQPTNPPVNPTKPPVTPTEPPTTPTKPPVTPTEPTKPPVQLNDITGHWAEANIKQAVTRGIISGYSDGSFKPTANATRLEFIAMLVRALNLTAESTEKHNFKDNSTIPAWGRSAVDAAFASGLITGDANNQLKPFVSITRAEMAVILVRAKGIKVDPNATLPFADSKSVPKWAVPSVAAAYNAGLLNGVGGNRFAPTQVASRAEVVSAILAMDNIK